MSKIKEALEKGHGVLPVSYTHLDVYKRQPELRYNGWKGISPWYPQKQAFCW